MTTIQEFFASDPEAEEFYGASFVQDPKGFSTIYEGAARRKGFASIIELLRSEADCLRAMKKDRAALVALLDGDAFPASPEPTRPTDPIRPFPIYKPTSAEWDKIGVGVPYLWVGGLDEVDVKPEIHNTELRYRSRDTGCMKTTGDMHHRGREAVMVSEACLEALQVPDEVVDVVEKYRTDLAAYNDKYAAYRAEMEVWKRTSINNFLYIAFDVQDEDGITPRNAGEMLKGWTEGL